MKELPSFLLSPSRTLLVAPKFVDIQERVARIIKNKILVGHRIWNFLSVGVNSETGFELTEAI